MEAFFRLLNIYPEEKKVTGTLFGLALALGLGRVLALTAGFSIFLQVWTAADLAYVYILTSVGTIAASAGYLRLGRTLPPRLLIITNLVTIAGITLALWVLVSRESVAGGAAMALVVWSLVVLILSNLAFWGAATKVIDIRQGKRLFPVVATGDVLGYTLGGFTAKAIVGSVGTPQLLLFAAGGFAVAISIFALLGHQYRDRFVKAAPSGATRRERKPITWSNPYLRFMVGYFLMSGAAFVFVDNAFNTVAKGRYPDQAAYAAFFGTYQAVTAIINFFFRSFGAGRMIERFGVVSGLLALPVALLTGSLLVAVAWAVGSTVLVFWFMTSTRVADKVFRGVQATSFATLYQPLMDKGPAVQTTMEGIVDAFAVGSAGLLLLILTKTVGVEAGHLALILIVLSATWIGIALLLRGQYVSVLGGVLTRRRISAGLLKVTDEVVPLVKDELDSHHPENVVYALDLLERSDVPFFLHAVRHVLNHDVAEVRIEALKLVEKHRATIALDRVRKLADSDPDPNVRGWAMRTLCVVDEDAMDLGVAALKGDDHDVRRGAMVGLLRSGSMEGIVYAGSDLLKFFESDTPTERQFAANVLRDTADGSFYRAARKLLKDKDPNVRRAAIEAAGAMGHTQLWLPLVKALADDETATTAARALALGGDAAVRGLMKGFRHYDYDRSLRITILRLLGRIGTEKAASELNKLLDSTADEERYAAVKALTACGYEPDSSEWPRFRQLLINEIQDVADAYAAVADLSGNEDLELLREALEYEIDAIHHRLFLFLNFLYPKSDAITAWNNYAHGDRDRRAYALELVDNFIDADLRELLFPALEDMEVEERLEKWEDDLAIIRRSPRAWLQRVLEAPEGAYTRWTVHCARFAGPAVGVHVSEARDATIVDQTLRLRGVNLFADMPPPVLAEVVPRLREIKVDAGDTVFSKGDPGDSLYILDEGEVDVHEDGLTLATLPAGRVFGEFTVLQSAERTATVTATQKSHLYRFDQRELYNLIADQVAIARALVRIILRRLHENRAARAAGPSRTSRVSISLEPLE